MCGFQNLEDEAGFAGRRKFWESALRLFRLAGFDREDDEGASRAFTTVDDPHCFHHLGLWNALKIECIKQRI